MLVSYLTCGSYRLEPTDFTFWKIPSRSFGTTIFNWEIFSISSVFHLLNLLRISLYQLVYSSLRSSLTQFTCTVVIHASGS